MFGFCKKKQKPQQSTQPISPTREIADYSPLVRFALDKAHIDQLPDDSVGVIIADAVDILGASFLRGLFLAPVIVYRTGDYYEFYNHELTLCGDIQILKRDGGEYDIEVNGEGLQPYDKGVFQESPFLNVISFDYDMTDRRIKEKFKGKKIFTAVDKR